MIWHNAKPNEVLNELSVDDKTGLANGVVDERLCLYGQNVISEKEKPSFLKHFKHQLKSKTVITLIIIAVISFIVAIMYNEVNFYSPLLLIAIVTVNALISAYYIYNSGNMLEKIKLITNPTVSVLREGVIKSINSTMLVPGDIILLEEGDYIPADARVLESNEFRCNESLLTGVEIPVEKNENYIFEDITPLEKRANMIFSGCSVAHGNAKAVVVATGIDTEIGKTASILEQTGENRLPLQNELDSIGKIANYAILIICAIVFLLGILFNFNSNVPFASMTLEMLINSVALAVAAIPEGLPAIATIVIALGINRILEDKIIVKDADAAELLGRTDVICSDKTGVFTHNKMVLSRIYNGKRLIDLDTEGADEEAALIIRIATACSTLNNDSTENAIEKACLAYNSMSKLDVDNILPHLAVIPFDPERKTMTVISMINDKPFAIIKGAPESVVPNCINCDTKEILSINENLANEAFRNICIAMKRLEEIPANPQAEDIENNLTFVGLLGLQDPPREGVIEEIAACDTAGIKTIMITGDNISTAKAIARRIGILKDGTEAISGLELSELSDEELYANIEKYSVFARVSPTDKLRIVKAWQSHKKIVTITGDSVQDADALAQAEVGCAIGKFGADIAKGNAEIIIQNNRFDSIVRAIKESRGLFSNIKKSVSYLLSCGFAKILIVFFGLIFFKIPPITAIQHLWLKLLIDSAPAISLSMEKADNSIMKNKPLSNIGKIFDNKTLIFISVQSIYIALVTLISYFIGKNSGDGVAASTMAFATLGFAQIFHCLNNKFTGSIFNKEILSNKFMNYSVSITLFIILFLIFTPAGFLFDLCIIKFWQFIICFIFAVAIIPLCEILKFVVNKLMK